jgi:hypothetical protein
MLKASLLKALCGVEADEVVGKVHAGVVVTKPRVSKDQLVVWE